MFMFLESLHTYSLVAYVVKKNGILSRLQNTLVGWGFSIAFVSMSVGFMYEDYGGIYHCWLQVNKSLVYAQVCKQKRSGSWRGTAAHSAYTEIKTKTKLVTARHGCAQRVVQKQLKIDSLF